MEAPRNGLDIITDFVLGLNTPAADHLEFLASGFAHGLVVGGAPVATAAAISSASNPGSDGHFIFDNTVYWDAGKRHRRVRIGAAFRRQFAAGTRLPPDVMTNWFAGLE